MEKHRPFGVTLLAILAGLAAVVAFYHGLQLLGILPFKIGEHKFFAPEASWFAAIMWGVLGFIYIWVMRMLWKLDAQGWLFVVILSALNLVMALLSIIGQSTWDAMLPSLLVNGVILLYCLVPSTREAFGAA
jgi:hypothetical protein